MTPSQRPLARAASAAWIVPGNALLVVLLVLSPLIVWIGTAEQYDGPKLALLHLSALGLLALVVPVWSWSNLREQLREPIVLGPLLFLLSAIVSTLTSVSPWLSVLGEVNSGLGLVTIAAYVVVFLAVRALGDAERAWKLLSAVAVVCGVLAVYALFQLGDADPMIGNDTSQVEGWIRPVASLGHANHLGGYLACGLPFVLALAIRARGQGRLIVPLLFALTFLLGLAALVVTLSRSAWLGAITGGLCVGVLEVWRRNGRRVLVLLGVALVVAVGLVLLSGHNALGRRIAQFGSSPGRWLIWSTVGQLFAQRPLLGWGSETLQSVFGICRSAESARYEPGMTPTRAHNELLHVLVSQGVFGLVGVLVFGVGLVRDSVRAFRSGVDQTLVLALIASALAFVVQGLFSFTTVANGVLFATVAGLLSALTQPREAVSVQRRNWPLLGAGLVAGVVFVANVMAQGRALGWAAVGCVMAVELALAVGMWAAFVRSDARASAGSVPPSLAGKGVRGLGSSALPPTSPQPSTKAGGGRKTEEPSLARRANIPTLARAGAAILAAVLAWGLVLEPWIAASQVREGENLLTTNPKVACELFAAACQREPHREAHWVALARACELAASAEVTVERRRRYLDDGLRATERALELNPLRPENLAGRARMLCYQDGVDAKVVLDAFDTALARDRYNTAILVAAGRFAVKVGKHERGAAYLRRAVSVRPDQVDALVGLAELASMRGRLSEAREFLLSARASMWIQPEDREVLDRSAALLALVELRLGHLQEALVEAERISAKYPSWPGPRLTHAEALERLGKEEEAEREYRKILQRWPNQTRAREALTRLERTNPARAADGAVRQDSGIRSGS
jgi:O-antigen ligase/tetratricopeptide (TPR) repeat protein